jgi:hypothetical protein
MGVLAAGQSGATPTTCLPEPSATPVLRIHVYDLASVPDRTLRRAFAGATRVFAATGIELAWESGKTDAPEAHTLDMSARPTSGPEQSDGRDFLVVRLVGDFAPARPGALGFSLPNARMGAHVTVIYRRIHDVASLELTASETILGHVLAHEIGHVLLGSDKHSQTGIMKAVWSSTDYQRSAEGSLYFPPCEAAMMRREALRRAMLLPHTGRRNRL